MFLTILISAILGAPDAPKTERLREITAGECRFILFAIHDEFVAQEIRLAEEQFDQLNRLGSDAEQNLKNASRILFDKSQASPDAVKALRIAFNQGDAVIREKTKTTLSDEQLERLTQIYRQVLGPRALSQDKDLVTALELTAKQKEQIQSHEGDYLSAYRNAIRDARTDMDTDKLIKRTAELEQLLRRQIYIVLNDSQLNKWQELLGKPLTPNVVRRLRDEFNGSIP